MYGGRRVRIGGIRGTGCRYCQTGYIHYLGMSRYSYLFKNSLISLPNCNKSLISLVRELHRWPCQKLKIPEWVFFIFVQPPGLNRDGCEAIVAAPIREYTIRKIIKTGSVMTSFYRFLLLRIEEASENPSGTIKKILKNRLWRIFLILFIAYRGGE